MERKIDFFFFFPDKFLLATTTGTQVQLNMQMFFNHALNAASCPLHLLYVGTIHYLLFRLHTLVVGGNVCVDTLKPTDV